MLTFSLPEEALFLGDPVTSPRFKYQQLAESFHHPQFRS